MFAQDATTNDTIGITIARTRGIATYVVLDVILFTCSSNTNEPLSADSKLTLTHASM